MYYSGRRGDYSKQLGHIETDISGIEKCALYNILIVLLYLMGGKHRTRASASILVLVVMRSSDIYSYIVTMSHCAV